MMTTPTPMCLEAPALLRLLACASPAFPTGGFAYSQGLEWAVEAGQVHNQTTLQAWLSDVLHHGTARSDAILLRHAHRAAHQPQMLATLSTITHATALPAERQADAAAQGIAFQASTAPWEPNLPLPIAGEGRGPPRSGGKGEGCKHPPHPTPYPIAFGNRRAEEQSDVRPPSQSDARPPSQSDARPPSQSDVRPPSQSDVRPPSQSDVRPPPNAPQNFTDPETPYPIAFGAFTATQAIGEDAACLAYLANWASNSISAAIRLGVLGQAGGLRVLHALEPALQEIAQSTKSATLDDLGGTCFWADIAAMRHETQTTRLFRS